jgi:hypothetical protein
MWFHQVAENYRSLTFFLLPYLVYNQILLNLPRMHDLHFGCITKLTKETPLTIVVTLSSVLFGWIWCYSWWMISPLLGKYWLERSTTFFSLCYKGPIWLAFHKKNYWNKWRCPNTITEWRTLIVFPPERISGRPAFFAFLFCLHDWTNKLVSCSYVMEIYKIDHNGVLSESQCSLGALY